MHHDLSWAIGLFEGEGSVTVVTTQHGHKHIQIRLCMVDEDVVDRFHVAVGGIGRRGIQKGQNGGKQLYRWAITRDEHSRQFLSQVYPYLGLRRQQIIREKLAVADKLHWIEGS